MKSMKCFGWSCAFCFTAMMLQAQDVSEIERLKKQMQQMQLQIETLTKKLDELTKSQAVPRADVQKTEEQKNLEQQLAQELKRPETNAPPRSELKEPWSPAQPLTVGRMGSAYMNIGFDVLLDAGWSTAGDASTALELGDHDPHKRGRSEERRVGKECR